MTATDFDYVMNYETKINGDLVEAWHTPECALASVLSLVPKDCLTAVQGCAFHFDHVPPEDLLGELLSSGEIAIEAPTGAVLTISRITPPQQQTS